MGMEVFHEIAFAAEKKIGIGRPDSKLKESELPKKKQQNAFGKSLFHKSDILRISKVISSC